MKPGWQKWLVMMLRLGFGLFLIIAAIDKIRHPYPFADVVENYRVLGEGFSRWVAVWLPVFEILLGVMLIVGIWLDAAALLNALLMTAFFILVTQAYARGLDIRCGCYFFEGEAVIGLQKIIENLVLTGLSLLLFFIIKMRRMRRQEG